MDRSARKLLAGVGVAVLAASIAGPVAAQDASAPAGGYTIGISNNAAGNGWREEMICSMKAQALASGEVAGMNIIHHTVKAPEQLDGHADPGVRWRRRDRRQPRQTRTPSTRRSPRPTAANIVVVAVDSPVTDRRRLHPVERPGELRLPGRQVAVRAAAAARVTSSTCAASPACRLIPTAIRASSEHSPSTGASRSSARRSPTGRRRSAPSRSPTCSTPA